MHPLVVHKNRRHDVYVGRPTIFGNPWSHKPGTLAAFTAKDRDDAVECYRAWLLGERFTDVLPARRKDILKSLPTLRGKVLACWCAPLKCHAEVLVELSDNKYSYLWET